jgi:hydrogenase expression/formation protein HypE
MNHRDEIQLGHGSGGKLSFELIRNIILPQFKNKYLEPLDDQAVIRFGDLRLAFTTDSYTVDPIFFPGGDIGSLAVNGTINDLATGGARPIYMSAGFIIEEGFSIEDFKRVVSSMKKTACDNGVEIITGDTKVVQKGKGDKIFINTTGIGVIEKPVNISGRNARAGDAVIVSGGIAEHGIAILSARERLGFETEFASDTRALWSLVSAILDKTNNIHCMRDPTRGGLASTLNEIATSSNVCITIFEEKIPVKSDVRSACDILGLDPLYIANEGVMVVILPEEEAEAVLEVMKTHPAGRNACIIGKVAEEPKGMVLMRTRIGGRRIVDMLTEDLLPRIC